MRTDTLLAEKITRSPDPPAPASEPGPVKPWSHGLLWVHLTAILFLLLAIIRFRAFTLIDWDEGVFMLQGRWLATLGDAGKPFNFQTPPLYQFMIAVLSRIAGGDPRILLAITTAFSLATLYLIYALTRRLYSSGTAARAVALFAVSEFFLFFSGSGLSDAVFLFFFWAAISFFLAGVRSGRRLTLAGAGLCTVLAFYTKYSAPVLLLIYPATAWLFRLNNPRRWLFWCVLLPVLAVLPYAVVYVMAVAPAGILSRHATMLGLHHLQYLVYLLFFSPALLILSLASVVRLEKTDYFFVAIALIYLVIVGFYRPYFRLAYPVIPALAILAARSLERTGPWKTAILAAALFLSLVLGSRTVLYRTKVPTDIAETVIGQTANAPVFLLATVPPNITSYLPGIIALPDDHQATRLGHWFPRSLKNRLIISRKLNLLVGRKRVLALTSTVVADIVDRYPALFARGHKLASWEFIDAPVYLKDPFNPLQKSRQLYDLYEFNVGERPDVVDDLWRIGFEPGSQMIRTTGPVH